MSVLDEFLEKVPTAQRALVRSLDAVIVRAAPRLTPSLKWGNLTYHAKRNVCSLVSHKTHVNLQVWGGANLKDPSGLLVGVGKDMRHIKVTSEADVDSHAIAELVKGAARLGGACPATRRRRLTERSSKDRERAAGLGPHRALQRGD